MKTKRDWVLPIAVAVFSFAITAISAAYAAYTNNDKAITGRVIAVEKQQENDKEWRGSVSKKLDRMDDKLDEIRKEVK